MSARRGTGTVYLRGQTWWLQFYHHGQAVRESSGSTVKLVAERLLKARVAESTTGKLVIGADRVTLKQMTEMVLADYEANDLRSAQRVKAAIAHLWSHFGALERATAITSASVTEYQALRRREKAANSTINYECRMLGRGFRLAVRAGLLANIPVIASLRAAGPRKGFFEPEQYGAVLGHLPDYLHPVVKTLYITGWRKNKVLSRQWKHVDLEQGWLRLDPGESKNGEARNFPLTTELHAILSKQREAVRRLEREQGVIIRHVFVRPDGSHIKNFRSAWKTATRRAGCPGRLVHDFRRTACRSFERAGIPRSAAMKLSGHLTSTIYERYAIADAGMLKKAAEKLDRLHAEKA